VKVKSWKQANPRKVKEYGRQYCQRHPEALKAAKANRRAREARIGGTLSAADVKKIILLWGGHCWICGRPYGAIDHVIPLARGGSNCPSNLRPICKSCNSSKGAKIVNEKWLEARRTKLGVTCIPTRIEPVEVPLSL
jgi:5-methylcytosine-specific restriction endonuclease McrA